MPRHVFTKEERQKGGREGFRAAVLAIQTRYWIDFNKAVQWVKYKRVRGGK